MPDEYQTCRSLCHTYHTMSEMIIKSVTQYSNIYITPPADEHDLVSLCTYLSRCVHFKFLANLTEEETEALQIVTRCAKVSTALEPISCEDLKKYVLIVDEILERVVDSARIRYIETENRS
jgi:hypothetical protein